MTKINTFLILGILISFIEKSACFTSVNNDLNVLNLRTLSSSSQVLFAKGKTVDEALSIYAKRYPKREPNKNLPWSSWGMPGKDLDGTSYKVSTSGSKKGKSIFDVDVAKQRANFMEISRLYGEDNALQMTKGEPAILAFDKKNFAPSLKEYGKIFGVEEAKAMVIRNPGLLAVKPTGYGGADAANDQTMQLSYVVAATRPAGPFLLYGTLGLLCIPAIESISGIPFRANLLASILQN
mmetsp:Transcript_6522/g.9449  ORF Transcript_6522/g.9449 Transcript_6522/m.9449 type:complete len:238 (+) Transcript_6522:52-765(+)